jgi:hypothetical protein
MASGSAAARVRVRACVTLMRKSVCGACVCVQVHCVTGRPGTNRVSIICLYDHREPWSSNEWSEAPRGNVLTNLSPEG